MTDRFDCQQNTLANKSLIINQKQNRFTVLGQPEIICCQTRNQIITRIYYVQH